MKKLLALLLLLICRYAYAQADSITEIEPGIWKIRFGQPDKFTPVTFREGASESKAINALQKPGDLPFKLTDITCQIKKARTVLSIPCDEPGEQIFGFGLDSGAFQQKKLRKYLTVSSSCQTKTGASHAPVPFYVSTKGYGVYVDTARVPFVHVATLSRHGSSNETKKSDSEIKTSVKDLYRGREIIGKPDVVFDIPGAAGIDVYVFAGPGIKTAVQRYNLFSGGGCIPPMWGLGIKYRNFTKGTKETVMNVAESIRKYKIPCDMLGLEPGWQTRGYSCSLVWSDDRFKDHQSFIDKLNIMGFRPNLWEHAYIHPSSPLFKPLADKAGDFLVWEGLVIDFADSKASEIFADYHREEFITKGIYGFKADECDRQFITDSTPFNYPYCSTFPSGIDGDQMTQLYGFLYQKSIYSAFKKQNLRTWGDVRASTSLATPLPFNLYSDSYGFDEYLRQLVNSSFTGILWSPEVRSTGSLDELLNRTAMSTFAHQTCFNPWFIPNPLWAQYNADKNKRNELLNEQDQKAVAGKLTEILNQRMSLIPYLYSAFYRYHDEGLPPLRAVVMDFPEDKKTWAIDNQFMFGESMLIAPLMASSSSRKVYLPSGTDWYDFHSDKKLDGGEEIEVKLQPGQTPIFIKDNSLIPWAKPVQFIADNMIFDIVVKVYGNNPEAFTLYADDGISFDYEKGDFSKLSLQWKNSKGLVKRSGNYKKERYSILSWQKI